MALPFTQPVPLLVEETESVTRIDDYEHVCSYLYLELSVSFQGPNWCWHIDGYDKLKPFGFPIHACIDG